MNKDTYVIIPIYNEDSIVGDVIKEAKKYFENVVCINDGSTDASSQVIKEAGGILIEHSTNFGAGAATQTGIEYALLDKNAKEFITIDADGQHEIKDAVNMLEYMKENKLDIVLGSRFLGKVHNIAGLKKLFLRLAASFSKMLSGIYLTDPHIGIRVFNRNFAENLKLTMPDFSHASELVHRIAEGNYKYAEIPVTITYSDYSKAKGQPMLNAINIVFDVVFHRISKK
jgi:glycosyltransferase involved in cell wall biosynthesis